MSERCTSSTRVPTRASKKKAPHGSYPPRVNLSVRDRRHKTRLLNETQRRKDQLLGLTTYDVAAHLHRYTMEPNAVMDESREGCATSSTKKKDQSSTKASTPSDSPGTPDRSRAPAGEENEANTRWHAQYVQHLQQRKNTSEQTPGPSSPSSSAPPHLRTGDVGNDDNDDGEALQLPPPPRSYEEWMIAGCPTGPWAALLQDEVYAPVEAERALLTAKYNPKGRSSPPLP
ncbi:hypothetical protein ABL78_1057 [Leptomonas seymouri]|uniref:Uncharacterized protein n=1 Tax=Leptomonas seymouri TaxID=5684 RepID=A0A0N1I154_LEPSE|nr:hypothetical protein ABL78_1057 [Leptomonas seymouri]|eukprot:KPI89794.1 hypothetical protein ABL78_1057 [Leptomonas seymouri]